MAVPARFGILRFMATLLKIAAWVVLILSILTALLLGLAGPLIRQSLSDMDLLTQVIPLGSAGVMAGITLIVLGTLGFFGLFATAETLQLQLAIEENTRLTAALLLRLDQEANPTDIPLPVYYAQVDRD